MKANILQRSGKIVAITCHERKIVCVAFSSTQNIPQSLPKFQTF